jgi:hypothetical protein
MPDHRSGVLYGFAAITAAVALRMVPAVCPLESAGAVAFTDPKWGKAFNVDIRPQAWGSRFEALSNGGRHRVILFTEAPTGGKYRISVDTEYEGSKDFQIEIGGGVQKKYGRLVANLKTGEIVEKAGDIVAAGVETLSTSPARYRWWVDMDFVPGAASYNLAILDTERNVEFAGTKSCKMILNNPAFAKVDN